MRSNHYYNKPAVTEKPKKGPSLTSDQIAQQISEFEAKGNKIEVLPADFLAEAKIRIEDNYSLGGGFA